MTIESEINKLIEKFTTHHYTNFIKNKKVIIVGPNTALKGKHMGKYIDSFDIVIRHNTVFDFLPFNDEYKKDYGSRTDILYLSPSCIKKYSLQPSTLVKLNKNKIKYIVYQNGNRERKYLTGDYCFMKNLDWFKTKLATTNTKLHYSHHSSILLTKLLNDLSLDKLIVPRTGFISIFDMLIHNAKTIETIGMSFKGDEGGGHLFRPDALKVMDPLLTHDGFNSPHDSNKEQELAEILTEKYAPNFIFK